MVYQSSELCNKCNVDLKLPWQRTFQFGTSDVPRHLNWNDIGTFFFSVTNTKKTEI